MNAMVVFGASLPALAVVLATTSPAAPGDPGPPSPRANPPLVLAAGPMIGPHAIGSEDCRPELARCERAGSFFGFGLNVELRARLWRILYGHVRPWVVGNVAGGDGIYDGAGGVGVGLGVYGQHVFGRGEYVGLGAFGDSTFEPPFYEGPVGRDDWGHHAGMATVGFRGQLPVRGRRLGIELWGGPMFGPRSVRRIAGQDTERRVLMTFMLGVNLSFDVIADRTTTPARNSRTK